MEIIGDNGSISVETNKEQRVKLKSFLLPYFRRDLDICHVCCVMSDKLIYNPAISIFQCEECYNDWQKNYPLTQEDKKVMNYNLKAVRKIL